MSSTTDLRKYELMVIFSGDLLEKDFEKELTELRKAMQENSHGISYEDNWGRRDFSYRFKRQNRGFYVVFNLTARPEQIAELQANIKLNQAVLRHLVISIPEGYEPKRYAEAEIVEKKPAVESRFKMRKVELKPIPKEEPAKVEKPTLAGKEDEEELKKVEKKLSEILENPDIEIK